MGSLIWWIFSFAQFWEHRHDQNYATCNALDTAIKKDLTPLFEDTELEGMTYSCGKLEGAFPTKTWTIDYYIRGVFEPRKTAQVLEEEIAKTLLAAQWKEGSYEIYKSENNKIDLKIEILSARYNLYKLAVSTTSQIDAQGSTNAPIDVPWSNDTLLRYPPYDIPQLTYAPTGSEWGNLTPLANEQYTAKLRIDEKVDPSISLVPATTTSEDSTIIATGKYDNPIYLIDDEGGDFKTTINGISISLTNLRNLYNDTQFSNDEAIQILNGLVFDT